MIIIDKALQQRTSEGVPPIRVGMIGAGFMARGIAIQLASVFDGMIELAAICNRHVEKAVQVFATAGIDAPSMCTTAEEVRSGAE